VAGTTKTALINAGFVDGGPVGDADRSTYDQTEVRYLPGSEDKARVVASYLDGVGKLVALPAGSTGAAVMLVIGRDFDGVVVPGSTPATSSTTTSSTVAPNPGSTPGITIPATEKGRPQVGCG
jgi:hypothetical protein